jgi:hypothetical protein
MESIYKVGQESQIASKSFDNSLYEIFPDIESCVIGTPEIFNPDFVVEMKDGKGYSVIEKWDTTKGLLPDRKVIGCYYVTIFIQHGTPKATQTAYTVELDNYMNMYVGGFYVLVNKTSFPIFPFYMFYKHFNRGTQNIGNYAEFIGRHLLKNSASYWDFDLVRSDFYTKKDNRDNIINYVDKLVHPQYKELLDFVDKFRNFSEYKFDSGEKNKENPEDKNKENPEDKKEIYSVQSKIIKGLENKLNETLTKYKSSAQFIEEITSKLNEYLIQLTHKNREIDLKNAQILKLEHRLIETSKTLESEKVKAIGELNTEHELHLLTVKKQLVDAECFKAQCSSLDITLDDVKNDLSNAKLEIEKYKDTNRGLLQSVIKAKEELSSIKNNNDELLVVVSEYTKSNKNMEYANTENEKIIEKLKSDNKFLSDQVSQKYNEKNDELFKALNERIKELENEVKCINTMHEKVKTKKARSDEELRTIKQVLLKIK